MVGGSEEEEVKAVRSPACIYGNAKSEGRVPNGENRNKTKAQRVKLKCGSGRKCNKLKVLTIVARTAGRGRLLLPEIIKHAD